MPALNKNTLTNQVDLPTWEWCRFAPAVSSVLSSTCCADNSQFNLELTGRYIYYLISATQFVRYDTWTDMYQQLSSPPGALSGVTSMKFMSSMGFEGNVLSATSTTLQVPAVTGQAMKGFDVVIVSGTGAGQRRTIIDVAEPVIHDSGVITGGSNSAGILNMQDTLKAWSGNQYAGYTLRIAGNTGAGQIRRIIHNTATSLTMGDTGILNKTYNNPQIFSPAFTTTAGTQAMYSIESQVITLDSAWTTTPDSTSVFRVQSGAIILMTNVGSSPWHLIQWYDVLSDTWYLLPSVSNLLTATGTDLSLERTTENASIWEKSIATSGTTTTIVDGSRGVNEASWGTNQWAGYWLFIFSGTGAGQIRQIVSNTGNTLTWSSAGTAPDATSRYVIAGFDAGTATSGAASTLTDSTKSWTTNEWANFAVRIVAGTGIGQVRTISSNTSTALTIIGTWTTNPDSTSVYQLQGDPDKIYANLGGTPAILIHNIDAAMSSWGKLQDFGMARTASASVGGHLPVAISSVSNATTTATVNTAHNHMFRVGNLVTVRGATDANFNVTNVAIATVPSATSFTYTMAGTPASTTLVGSQSTTTLCDASKSWTTNQWAGFTCYMTTTGLTAATGTATGQAIRIASNTSNTLTFVTTGTAPTNGVSKYVISTSSVAGAADFGVATGTHSTTTLQDTTKTWVVNQWAGRRLRLLSGAAYPAEVAITSNTANTITCATITAPTNLVTGYAILNAVPKGTGLTSSWNFGASNSKLRGKYFYITRGGGLAGFDRYNINTDTITSIHTSPITETLTTGSMSAYDGVDRIYFHKDATQRLYYLDVNTLQVHGASMYPYAAPTAIIGNRMEIITTKDGLRYVYLNRASFAEFFRCLLYW